MEEKLERLAESLGLCTHYNDAGLVQKEYTVGENAIKFFCNILGYKANTQEEIETSLRQVEERRWQKTLEKIYVVENDKVEFDVVLPSSMLSELMTLKLKNHESGQETEVSYQVINNNEEKEIDGKKLNRIIVRIDTPLTIGYYEIALTIKNKTYKTILAVCPQTCYEHPVLDKKIWGFAIQLYSVKSERNWGVGDFTDLGSLVKLASNAGADIIGLNPLNVLQHNYPEEASPYSSISRLFLNPIYIDVEAVPEFNPEDLAEIQKELEELRNSELIQYTKVYNLKMRFLEKCYATFKDGKNKERQAAYKAFCKEQGTDLEKLAVFQTLYEDYSQKIWGGWNAWPQEYRHPDSPAVKQYAKDHADRVGFFKYLQFECATQFAKAQNMVSDYGLGIGFYRDLAVGVGKDSAELWSNPELFVPEVGAGAPPDAFFPAGQKWCLGAFWPEALKEDAYEPFLKILRANMKNAGALRMDHVMSLMRLFLIPDNGGEGTYLKYNFKDMVNLVALESHLNHCTIVGESIGNVPDGFLEALKEKNIHPLSVLWAERDNAGWGDFRSPSSYPAKAFTSVGTHDMAPLRMWWFGYDIELSYSLGLIADEQSKNEAYHKRELDRWKLLFALDSNGVWPEDNQRKSNYIYGEGYPEGIEEAVHRFVSRSASIVFLAQLEDIFHVEKLQNLPGTDRDKHPNWRRKLPVALEKMEGDIAYIRNINAIHKER